MEGRKFMHLNQEECIGKPKAAKQENGTVVSGARSHSTDELKVLTEAGLMKEEATTHSKKGTTLMLRKWEPNLPFLNLFPTVGE
jgi:hypothetical protein